MMYDNDRGGGLKDLDIMVRFKQGFSLEILISNLDEY